MSPPSPKRPRKPRRRWRWHVPPAITHAGESLEGSQILDDFPDALGMLLWCTFRDAVLWGGVAPEEREGLFRPGAHAARMEALEAAQVAPALRGPLEAAAEVCRDAPAADPLRVMEACLDLAAWAEREGRLATAVALATAGAAAVPAHAGAAFRVGRLARKNAEYARAESWFRRTIGLARQARDWASYAEAFLGLGRLYVQRGNFPAARKFYIRGLRAARRHSLRDIQASALHDLFGMAVESGQRAEAAEFARAAFRAYGARHPRVPMLAHDVAYFWLTQGWVEPALGVFRAVLPHLVDPGERLVGLADLGRAAAEAGDEAEFEAAWDAVWAAAHEWDARAHAAQALLDLANGAARLGDWGRAERAASAARELAERRGESRIVLAAEDLVESVARKRAPDAPAPPAKRASAGTPRAAAESLAEELVRTLRVPGGPA